MRGSWVLLAGSLLVAALPAIAQPVRSVGLLVPGTLQTQTESSVLLSELRRLGYREPETLRLVLKEGQGNLDRLPKLARELVEARVEVIVAFNTPGVRAAIDATREIPIVMTQVGDPVGSGFVANLARPGGNVTGFTNRVAELAPKRMEVLLEALPLTKRVAVLFNPSDPVTKPQIRHLEASRASIGADFQLFPVRRLDELAEAFRQALAWKAHAALWLNGQHQVFQPMSHKLAAQHKLPVMVGNAGDVQAGGLISYSNSSPENYQRTAAVVDLILKGRKPGDIPVEQPTKFELAINLKAARALGLTIPRTLVLRADHMVE